MKLTMLSILMAVCSSMLAQEPAAPAAPPAPAPEAQAKEENAPRKIPARIAAGTIIALDAEKHSVSIARTDDGGKGETAEFYFDARMRIYRRNQSMTLKDLVPGTGVKVHYVENRDGTMQIRRVMIDPPKPDAPTQSGGTGN